ncbi:Hypothetical protein CINCED_3A010577 [Cinara cedri]|uniref:Uncharacterized protein n=1 Tax=Cinara cedri TaxID=506608 RepID=A0A5E4MVZ1_9HEMI|nr:Hypothetical protein CINCED_3A010577 [Cinara cedri]
MLSIAYFLKPVVVEAIRHVLQGLSSGREVAETPVEYVRKEEKEEISNAPEWDSGVNTASHNATSSGQEDAEFMYDNDITSTITEIEPVSDLETGARADDTSDADVVAGPNDWRFVMIRSSPVRDLVNHFNGLAQR